MAATERAHAPIYQLFVEQAIELEPRYLSMVIPSRWLAGGKGLDEFRESMLTDDRLRATCRLPERSTRYFQAWRFKGGVCYFLWDRDHDGPCDVSHSFRDGQPSASQSPAP